MLIYNQVKANRIKIGFFARRGIKSNPRVSNARPLMRTNIHDFVFVFKLHYMLFELSCRSIEVSSTTEVAFSFPIKKYSTFPIQCFASYSAYSSMVSFATLYVFLGLFPLVLYPSVIVKCPNLVFLSLQH